MNKHIVNNKSVQNSPTASYETCVDTFIDVEQALQKLPELSPVEKVQLEHDIAISHLYHSSKIEGTNLNTARLEKATHA